MEDGAPVPGDLGLAKFLFTDASCRVPRAMGRKPVAGWAAMLVTGERSVLHSDTIRKRAQDSTYCELLAVALALDHFTKLGELAAGDRVLAFLDNQQAIAILTSPRPRWKDADKRLTAAREHVRHLETKLDLAITYSWVPAHQGQDSTDWRCLIHNRVDRLARWHTGQEMARRNGLAEVLDT